MSGEQGELRVAILTISDSASRGEREDRSGEMVAEWVAGRGFAAGERRVVPDEIGTIAGVLAGWADADAADLIVTTGGTGLAERDVTPEATRRVLEREVPGIPEALRFTAHARVPQAVLSRGVAGTRGRTLIVNLPGSPGGVRDGLAVLDALLPHAVDILQGTVTSHDD